MDLFEYQARDLLASHGVPVLPGGVAETPEQAEAIAREIGQTVVVKAQVKTGGRGKAGGVKLADDAEDAKARAQDILGLDIKGHITHKVMVAQASDIAEEYYFSYLLDRSNRTFLAMASVEGGVEIEQLAVERPEALARVPVDATVGVDAQKAAEIVDAAGFPAEVRDQVIAIAVQLWDVFAKEDATLVEVNPLAKAPDGTVLALDAKVTLDDSAAFRHPEWEEFARTQVRDEREQLAHERGLQYVGLDGEVGIIANGAGLAMSTLDVVHQVGGRPANFLDIGGGARAAVMASALEVINTDPNVRCIFINIFGGITKGEEVAKGIVEALGRVELASPIVVRLDGTNAAEGRAILAGHEFERLVSKPTMLDGARTAVALAKRR